MSKYLTARQKKAELSRCGNDPVYFINNYCKINHPDHGLIPFKTWDFQDKIVRDFIDHRKNIILKARQLGISTITAAYCAWLMFFRRSKQILVIAIQFDVAKNLLTKVQAIIKHLPPWFKELNKITVDNRSLLKLTNDSFIKASATNEDAGRSEGLSLVILDEAAFIDGMDDIWAALKPTVGRPLGRIIAISTPNGMAGWFYDMYNAAEKGDIEWNPTKLHWTAHPERDEKWFNNEVKDMPRRKIAQEYECSFLASGETVINSDDLVRIRNGIKPPIYETGYDRGIWVWDEPQPGKKYFMTVDTARGDGEDFSAFNIFRISNMEQVAEYYGKLDTDIFADLIVQFGNEFNEALIIPENNNIGHELCKKIKDAGYSNLYYSKKGDHTYVPYWSVAGTPNCIPGFTMSQKTRELVFAKLEEFVRNKDIIIKSARLITELETFVWKNGRAEAQKGKHDDLVVTAAIACWVHENVFKENQDEISFKKLAMKTMFSTNTQLNTTIPGMRGWNKNTAIFTRAKKEIQDRKKYSWVYKG